MSDSLLEVSDLTKSYRIRKGLFKRERFYALRGVSLSVKRGEILGVVGESGSGKTTLGKLILRLERPDRGKILFEGRDIWDMGKEYTARVSVVFQDPRSSLNPRMKVGEIIEEPLRVHGIGGRKDKIISAIRSVYLNEEFLERKPDDLSGGQRQRVAIARAIVLEPDLLIADEPTASLDVSVQREILDLFLELKKRGLSLIFITHDIRVVEKISDRIAVIFGGMIMEMGDVRGVLKDPLHPYTRFLLGNVPVRHPSMRSATDVVEFPQEIPKEGCPFRHRCPEATEECGGELRRVELNGRIVTCLLY
jgi:peptide/nickel transport system ATP-binding protein